MMDRFQILLEFSLGVANGISGRSTDSLRRPIRPIPLPQATLFQLQTELLRQTREDQRPESQECLQFGEREPNYQSAQHGPVDDQQDQVQGRERRASCT